MNSLERELFLKTLAAGSKIDEKEYHQLTVWLENAPEKEVELFFRKYAIAFEESPCPVEIDLNLEFRIEKALDNSVNLIDRNQIQINMIKRNYLWKAAAAALIISIFGVAAHFYLITPKQKTLAKSQAYLKSEILPGVNKAVLSLSDGSIVVLDDVNSGQVASQGGIKITKLANGQLLYRKINELLPEVVYNTLTTPRGGQYSIILPDGSKVWLNAASSIRYPTFFSDSERRVELTGEAYFEIAHNAKKPFKVTFNGLEVKVLGTHFNINSYKEEKTSNTTLIEGSVSLSKGDANVILKSGDQAQVGNSDKITVIDNVDVHNVLAWKNGYFSFDKSDLKLILRQISRWYDVDISFEGESPKRVFSGKINRNSNISDVLKILNECKVNFRIEGRKLIVMG
jgi:hypothetical protein